MKKTILIYVPRQQRAAPKLSCTFPTPEEKSTHIVIERARQNRSRHDPTGTYVPANNQRRCRRKWEEAIDSSVFSMDQVIFELLPDKKGLRSLKHDRVGCCDGATTDFSRKRTRANKQPPRTRPGTWHAKSTVVRVDHGDPIPGPGHARRRIQ
jgi:hypothetical protein